MANRVAMAFEKTLNCHQDVANAVKRRLIDRRQVAEEEFNRWAAVHVVFARSSNYAHAAKLLLENDYWEAAGIIARAIWEDAAVLAYIHSRQGQAEDFARLYMKSHALDCSRCWERLAKHGAEAPSYANRTEDDLDKQKNDFCAFREQLWQGKRDASGEPCFQNKSAWNGLSIELTFQQADLENPYDDSYAQLCTLVHPSAFAASYAYQPEIWNRNSIDLTHEREQASWVTDGLIRALGIELWAAHELIGVAPENGIPDFKALLNQIRASK